MQSSHRKIELQSPSDLTYLTTQIRTAARQKLDLHLPSVPSDTDAPDDLRRQTEVLVDGFVAQVLAGMRANISINGLDIVAAQPRSAGFGEGDAMEGVEGAGAVHGVEEEEFEPFDEKLRARLAEHVAKRDKLIASISKHRRETPRLAARRWEEQFEREMGEVDRLQGLADENARMLGEEDVLSLEEIQREEEVRRNWERAVEGLGRLNKGLPETRARLERCGDVVGYLGVEKK